MSGYSTPRPISSEDNVAEFDSGEPSLDDWLRTRAVTNHASGASRCFVTSRDERARDFHLHHDFEPSPTDPVHLMLLMKDGRKVV